MKNVSIETQQAIAAVFAEVNDDGDIANILRCVGQNVMRNVAPYKVAYDAQTAINKVARDIEPKTRPQRLVRDAQNKKRIDDLKIWNKKQEAAIDAMAAWKEGDTLIPLKSLMQEGGA